MSSYCRSRKPTISEKLSLVSRALHPVEQLHVPCLVVNLVAEAWGVDDGERDASTFLIEL